MREIALMFRNWWDSLKKEIPQMRKPFIILFFVYLVGLSSLIRANYNYMIADYKTRQAIKNNKYEVIHVHGNSSMIILEIIAGILGGAKIRIAHSHNTTCSNDKLSIFLRPIFNILCNVRISCGEAAGKWMFGKKDFIK